MSDDSKDVRRAVATSYFLLADREFPQGAILFGVGGDEHFTPHSTLVDPSSGLEIAYVENAKHPSSPEALELAKSYRQLRKRSKTAVPVYLLCLSTQDKIQAFALTDNAEWEPISRDEFPSFKALSASRETQNQKEVKAEKKNVANELKKAGESLACFFIILAALAIMEIIEVSNQALWLLLGATVLCVLPHYELIQAAGVNLKRRKDAEF